MLRMKLSVCFPLSFPLPVASLCNCLPSNVLYYLEIVSKQTLSSKDRKARTHTNDRKPLREEPAEATWMNTTGRSCLTRIDSGEVFRSRFDDDFDDDFHAFFFSFPRQDKVTCRAEKSPGRTTTGPPVCRFDADPLPSTVNGHLLSFQPPTHHEALHHLLSGSLPYWPRPCFASVVYRRGRSTSPSGQRGPEDLRRYISWSESLHSLCLLGYEWPVGIYGSQHGKGGEPFARMTRTCPDR
jgi:hypothetical protein